MRNPKPFTQNQQNFLEILKIYLEDIDNPQGYTHHLSYQWTLKSTKEFGQLPTLQIKPRGSANRIKTEVMEDAGLINETRQDRINALRTKHSLKKRQNSAAKAFNRMLDEIMFQLKKHLAAAAQINNMFTRPNQTVCPMIEWMQRIVSQEYGIGAIRPKQAQQSPENTESSPEPSEEDKRPQKAQNEHRAYEEELHEVK